MTDCQCPHCERLTAMQRYICEHCGERSAIQLVKIGTETLPLEPSGASLELIATDGSATPVVRILSVDRTRSAVHLGLEIDGRAHVVSIARREPGWSGAPNNWPAEDGLRAP